MIKISRNTNTILTPQGETNNTTATRTAHVGVQVFVPSPHMAAHNVDNFLIIAQRSCQDASPGAHILSPGLLQCAALWHQVHPVSASAVDAECGSVPSHKCEAM